MTIANDFISIPAVTTVAINQDCEEFQSHYNFEVKNKDGVELIDLFNGMDKAAHRRIENARDYDFYGPGKTATSAQLLGHFVHYDGLDSLVRKGLRLSAGLFCLG
ncbi:hypothetical protein B0H16DRAFT_1728038 [Mycena metata]|uniref:Uncharacterized protein n=1 Tax=Mycena metata TaxID=1033252 RepID=A0AAD7N3I2_9AGAR|nr:hypothetical protein B0H16DRAFT_1728038 [Mycena metata]